MFDRKEDLIKFLDTIGMLAEYIETRNEMCCQDLTPISDVSKTIYHLKEYVKDELNQYDLVDKKEA